VSVGRKGGGTYRVIYLPFKTEMGSMVVLGGHGNRSCGTKTTTYQTNWKGQGMGESKNYLLIKGGKETEVWGRVDRFRVDKSQENMGCVLPSEKS